MDKRGRLKSVKKKKKKKDLRKSSFAYDSLGGALMLLQT